MNKELLQMDLVDHLRAFDLPGATGERKGLLRRVTGRFYTHGVVASHLVDAVLKAWNPRGEVVRLVEPFCGDGRLIDLLLERAASMHSRRSWEITLWDCDQDAVDAAKERIFATAKKYKIKARIEATNHDSFTRAPEFFGRFDLCITNPPWEVLKPDRRELTELSPADADKHIQLLRQYDETLRGLYPLSAPLMRFSGWGTNLARCGVEMSLRLLAPDGVAGIVSPSSLLADQMFGNIRKWVLSGHRVHDLAFYAAEARIFENVDQPSITMVAARAPQNGIAPLLSTYGKDLSRNSLQISPDEWQQLDEGSFIVPLQFGLAVVRMQPAWRHLPKFSDLESQEADGLWAGRELDETGHEKFLAETGNYLFIKGRMVKRFGIAEPPTRFVSREGPRIPKSADHHRLVWRDVARPNQKRRMHATIIPPGIVTGNSLNVAYFRDDNLARLKALLAVMNSLVFEAQVRSRLATAHISLGSVRDVHIPHLTNPCIVQTLAQLVDRASAGDAEAVQRLEVEVAQLYGLRRDDMAALLSSFAKIDNDEASALLSISAWDRIPDAPAPSEKARIPNHYSASLSELDLRIARAVPPGGNWKNIPESVPSQRLQQIRKSYAAGEGSRSTYYGRLHPDAPAYTISTYFARPGNGCHLHYDFGQHRVLSQREAARLQSFPDSFVFYGSKNSINNQIGNAVPPLLAYQIALRFPTPGQFIDLFSGAGGFALGFIWAGWQPIVANDVEESYLKTYQANIDDKAIPGDIRDAAVFNSLIEACEGRRNPKLPLIVLGGPPCQGFSTAGNRRSMDDERNWLFRQYNKVLQQIRPMAFVFENVTGLLNMQGGRVFEMIRRELLKQTESLSVWKLKAEEYGIPQRRTRVILVGSSQPMPPPPAVTQLDAQASIFGILPPAITVRDALSDLPPLAPGEDGSAKDYPCAPLHPYQRLMRRLISAEEYLSTLAVDEIRQAQTA
jgi:Alw26I/Eco31I/Esp3I family type II restriction m6 adenine DNA methyltransferase